MNNRKDPDYIDINGTEYWYDDDGICHNVNGYPAIINISGSKFWYKHGARHNDFGPAVIYCNGYKEWYVDGIKLAKHEFLQHKIKQFISNDE